MDFLLKMETFSSDRHVSFHSGLSLKVNLLIIHIQVARGRISFFLAIIYIYIYTPWVWPPPSMLVVNKGLVWDSLLNM